MNSNRVSNQYGTETKTELSGYKFMEEQGRGEFAKETVDFEYVNDFSSLLFNDPDKTDVVVKTVPAPKVDYNETDLVPSNTTMQHRSPANAKNKNSERVIGLCESEPYSEQDRQYKINSKGKVLIAVYAIVVMTIFAIIVLNTRLLNNLNNDVANMEQRIKVLQDQNYNLNDQLSFVSSDEEIARKAIEMGMTK